MEQDNPEKNFRETLYTVDSRGNRKWVYASVVDGFFRLRRRMVMIVLMGIYLLMPWITIRGEQGVLLDIVHRKFVVLGATFIATDTIFLFLLFALAALTLFFLTAIFGRIWCGWACPETVFLEFLFRPIERWIEGDHIARRKLDAGPWNFDKIRKKLTKHAIFAALSWIIASTFLAYFVGRGPLLHMMSEAPWENPFAFGVTLFVMGAMAFQFGWFREQFCTIVCPYGRFQSVLLDPQSLVIGYDQKRGEPRGKLGAKTDGAVGDCIDCGNCVKVCPTGIDIRNGLQMECINCTACIDACDAVMSKVKRPLGLIRYASQSQLEGKSHRILRPRVILYALGLIILSSIFILRLNTRQMSEFKVLRGAKDAPFTVASEGKIINHLHLHLTNKLGVEQQYQIELEHPPEGLKLIVPVNPYPVTANQTVTVPLFFEFSKSVLSGGKRLITVEVKTKDGFEAHEGVTLLGPGD